MPTSSMISGNFTGYLLKNYQPIKNFLMYCDVNGVEVVAIRKPSTVYVAQISLSIGVL